MDKIIELLRKWEVFQKLDLGDDFARFGQWLADEKRSKEPVAMPADYQISPNVQIGFLLGNLMAFSEIWTKLAFRNLPIQNFHDFGTLKFIESAGNPTKKEIAEDSLQEQSTTFEAIKRLHKNGLVKEELDKQDRRVRRVRLTNKGKEITNQAMGQAIQLSELLVGDLSQDDKSALIKILGKLQSFHEDLYQHADKEKVADYYKL